MRRFQLITAVNRFGLALAVFCLQTASVWACPMCKLANETDDPRPKAFMVSILFMLGMITSVFAGIGGLLVWINRLEQRSLADAGYQHVLTNGVNAPAS